MLDHAPKIQRQMVEYEVIAAQLEALVTKRNYRPRKLTGTSPRGGKFRFKQFYSEQ